MNDHRSRLLLLVGLVVLAGCLGGSDGGATGEAGTTTAMDGDAAAAGGSGDSTNWCVEGQTAEFTNPETGEQASWAVEGMVERDGRSVCKAVWETNQGEIRRMEMYYSEDEQYRELIAYDADGAVVSEVRMQGGGPSGSADSSGDADSSDDWCSDATTMEFVNPQTGERASWEVEGIVERDGRSVCKAVWETNQGEVRRIEMYFSEDEEYRTMVSYDADGEVVSEFDMGSG